MQGVFVEPHEYISTLRRHWIWVMALALIGGLVAFGYNQILPTLYRSTSTVFVASQQGDTTSELVQGSTFTQGQVQSLAALASLPIVLDAVIADLDLDTSARSLADSVSADIRLNTVIIDVTVTNTSPDQAARISNAVTKELARAAESLSTPDDAATSAITMTTVSAASAPSDPFSPNTRLLLATGVLAGLALAVLLILGRELLDTRVRTIRDLEKVSDDPILGTTHRLKPKDAHSLVMRSDPYGAPAEEFRRVATNLEFADVDDPVRAVVVTSPLPGEGKSTVSINLALAMAERFQRVLLIDADLRKPSVAEYCQVDGLLGLTSVLLGGATLTEAIRPWAGGSIDVLPAGIIPANPSQLVGSETMASVLKALISEYDFVVIDTPPLLPVTDALTLSKLVDGAIVVARYKSTRRHQLEQSLGSLEGVSARVLGVILNGDKTKDSTSYYGYAPTIDPAADEADGTDFNNADTGQQVGSEVDPFGESSKPVMLMTPTSEASDPSNSSPEISHPAEETEASAASGPASDDSASERPGSEELIATVETRLLPTGPKKVRLTPIARASSTRSPPGGTSAKGTPSGRPSAGPS